jgi:cytochrome bd ubiquinol oxidase subunit II
VLTSLATFLVNPAVPAGLRAVPLAWVATALLVAGLALVGTGLRSGRFLQAFLGSGAFILGLLAATAACVFPVFLRSTLDPAFDLTAFNASASEHGLRTGLAWWLVGLPIAVAYAVFLFRLHRGKVSAAAEGEGY